MNRERERALRSRNVEEECWWRFKKTKLGCLVFNYSYKYYTKRALKHLSNRKPYYHSPRIKSYYLTCDIQAD